MIIRTAAKRIQTCVPLESHLWIELKNARLGINLEWVLELKMLKDTKFHLSFQSLELALPVMLALKRLNPLLRLVMNTLLDGHTGNSKSLRTLLLLLVSHQRVFTRMMEPCKIKN
jgi:hypothetical protein